jgi:PQQ-dependent dehydrogenase (methanol/ethanol family)
MRFGRYVWLLGVVCALAFAPSAFAASKGTNGQTKTAATIEYAPAWTPAEQAATPMRDWINVGGNVMQQHYSGLNQINTGNAGSLKEAWHVHLDGSGVAAKYRNEATPLVYDGVMYVTTGNNDIFALDAATGARMWTHLSNIPQNINTICCGWDARGLAIGDGKIYAAQLDGKLVALDQKTGNLIWAATNGRWQDGYTMTMAPLYYKGLVIVGISGAEFGIRASVTAYDATDGHRVWRFYTIPTPGDIGSGTWPNNSEWQHGGGSVWNTPAVDTNTGLLTFSTGNADPWAGRGPGDDLFTSSFVALNAMTGDYGWHFQAVHHDIWDYDCPSPTMVVPNSPNGGQDAMVESCKTGFTYILNARDGNPLTQIDEKPVPQEPTEFTSRTQPVPVGDAFAEQCPTGNEFPALAADNQPFVYGCIWTPVNSKQFTVIAPGAGGGENYSPQSYNPQTGYIYTCSGNSRTALKTIPNASATYVGGQGFTGVQFGAGVTGYVTSGDFSAMNILNDRLAWKQHYTGASFQPNVQVLTSAACNGASLSTAGGLVFIGLPPSVGKALVAYDAKTGAQVASLPTDAGAGRCGPVAYTVNEKEYIADYACDRINQTNPQLNGDSVYAWTLG